MPASFHGNYQEVTQGRAETNCGLRDSTSHPRDNSQLFLSPLQEDTANGFVKTRDEVVCLQATLGEPHCAPLGSSTSTSQPPLTDGPRGNSMTRPFLSAPCWP